MARASIGTIVHGPLMLLLLPCAAARPPWSVAGTGSSAMTRVGASIGVSGWEKGKTFQTGDVFVFKYDPKMHNVVEVTEEEYKSCKTIDNSSRKFTSGHDRILLIGTAASYNCTVPGHYDKGMKIDNTIQ